MKKILFALVVLVLCLTKGHAQWRISIVAGPQVANFGGSDKKDWGGTLSDPDLVFRFHGGLMVNKTLSEKLSLSTGLLFSSKGADYSGGQYDASSQFFTYSYTTKLSYLDLPVIINYSLSKKWSIGLGPQLSFLLDATVKNDDATQRVFGLPETQDVKDSYNGLDAGLNAGMTYQLTEVISLQLFYQAGLLKISEEQGTDDKAAITNQVVKLSFGYTIR
jgi:hypothetical protein